MGIVIFIVFNFIHIKIKKTLNPSTDIRLKWQQIIKYF